MHLWDPLSHSTLCYIIYTCNKGIILFFYLYFIVQIGRSDKLTAGEPLHDKAALLEYEPVLECANKLRPGTNTVGGSVKQDFELDKRIVSSFYTQTITIYLSNS